MCVCVCVKQGEGWLVCSCAVPFVSCCGVHAICVYVCVYEDGKVNAALCFVEISAWCLVLAVEASCVCVCACVVGSKVWCVIAVVKQLSVCLCIKCEAIAALFVLRHRFCLVVAVKPSCVCECGGGDNSSLCC